MIDLDAPEPKSRKRPVNYNSKSLKWLREQGFTCGRVESYDAYSNRKADLFGIIDYVAISPSWTVGVQMCGKDFASHIKKITEERINEATAWLSCPHRELILIGWRKLKVKRGGKKEQYQPRIAHFWLNEKGELEWKERPDDTV